MKDIYLVTGASGHLGNVIVRKLLQRRENVRIFALPAEKHLPKNVTTFFGDVRDKKTIEPCFQNLNGANLIVIHSAGLISIDSDFNQNLYDVNVSGTKNIVDLCKEYQVSKFCYVSSVHAIPENHNRTIIKESRKFPLDLVKGAYAKTKAEATTYVMEAAAQGLNASIVHPSGLIGPYDSGNGKMTTLIIDYYKGALTSAVNGGYDFVDVRDVATGIISVCDKGRAGECYILSNQYYSIKNILQRLSSITGKKEIKRFLPFWFIKLLIPCAEAYYKITKKPALFTSYSIYTLDQNSWFSNEKAKEELGYTTRDMDITLVDTIIWLKTQGRIEETADSTDLKRRNMKH